MTESTPQTAARVIAAGAPPAWESLRCAALDLLSLYGSTEECTECDGSGYLPGYSGGDPGNEEHEQGPECPSHCQGSKPLLKLREACERTSITALAANAAQPLAREVLRLTEAQTQAARDVLAERERQKSVEGWSEAHDDEHDDGSLAAAGAAYALVSLRDGCLEAQAASRFAWDVWPWDADTFKPCDKRRRELVKGAALILAEIERLDRALAPSPPASEAAR